MRLFTCQQCGQLLYFENYRCESCGSPLGFSPHRLTLHTLAWKQQTLSLFGNTAQTFRYCANQQQLACNWLIPAHEPDDFCLACQLNRTIPDLSVPGHLLLWQKMETAKHRLVYTLLKLQLLLASKEQQPETGLAFDFLADEQLPSGKSRQVLTGHAQGLITLNIAEADDAERAKRRQAMGEPYRTLLGHFRHEVGHYYWDRLIADSDWLPAYRSLFGDEREDYGDALKRHYQQGAPANWADSYISTYATAHSWEDWAETWAHYLHMLDTLETAHAFGLHIAPAAARQDETLSADIDKNPYALSDFDEMLTLWFPLTYAMNSMNRSMGLDDLYPFIISPPVIEKLRFIHQVCQAARQ